MASNASKSSTIELPRCKDGSVDWDTLGNIITGHMLAEVIHAAYVDRKHGVSVTDSFGFTADTDWEFAFEKDDIVVMKRKGEYTYWLGRGVIDAPVNVVAEHIKDVHSARIWDKLLVETKNLRVLKETDMCTDYIGYMGWETTQCLFKTRRDMLCFVRCAFMDGKYIHSAISVEDPEYPVKPGITRVDARSGCGFVLEPFKGDQNQTLFNYLGNVDLKGVPKLIMTKVLKAHPVCAIQALRKYFKDQQLHKSWESIEEERAVFHSLKESSLSQSESKIYREDLTVGHYLKEESKDP